MTTTAATAATKTSRSRGFAGSHRFAPQSTVPRAPSIAVEKRYGHQTRIRRQSIAHARTALLAAEDAIARAESFDALVNIFARQLRDVPGTGELYRYDTAFRIGAYLGRLPERVYLHSGTRAGARALGLPYQKDALEMSEVPAELRHRAAYEVEDILCIYKDVFRGGETRRQQPRC